MTVGTPFSPTVAPSWRRKQARGKANILCGGSEKYADRHGSVPPFLSGGE